MIATQGSKRTLNGLAEKCIGPIATKYVVLVVGTDVGPYRV